MVRLTAVAETAERRLADPVIWHDVECAAYAADLPLWRELGSSASGPVLELGAGTGRVALDLARCGHDVTGLDAQPALVHALAARGRESGVRVRAEVGDARSLSLGRRFGLVVAPMQVVQLMGGASGREALLERIREHLSSGGLFAAALADPFEGVPPGELEPPLPDMREDGGWVYSSRPVDVRNVDGGVAIDRLRQVVSPAGGLAESMTSLVLDRLDTAQLESEAEAAGYRALPRRSVPESGAYVGSTVVLLEAAA